MPQRPGLRVRGAVRLGRAAAVGPGGAEGIGPTMARDGVRTPPLPLASNAPTSAALDKRLPVSLILRHLSPGRIALTVGLMTPGLCFVGLIIWWLRRRSARRFR